MEFASPDILVAACAIAVLAGLVKGLVGFAMPMVLISGLGSIVAPDVALAWLILPTLVTNWLQALRQGVGAALRSLHKFRTFLLSGSIVLVISAQLVSILPGAVLLLIIGVPVVIYSAFAMLMGRIHWRLPGQSRQTDQEAGIGCRSQGSFGGISGVWGPPNVAIMLTAIEHRKDRTDARARRNIRCRRGADW